MASSLQWESRNRRMNNERYEGNRTRNEVVHVPPDFKGRVIGRKHQIKQIQETSGAFVEVCPEGFLVRGSDDQREQAKKLIQEIVNPSQIMSGSGVRNQEILKVNDKLKGCVIGKGGCNIKTIREKCGAFVKVCADGFFIRGSNEQREWAKTFIQDVINSSQSPRRIFNERNDGNQEFVEVGEEVKGRVIGRKGCNIQMIIKTSGAFVENCAGGFLVRGSKEQMEYAKNHILQILDAKQNEVPDHGEMLDIPDGFKGLVIGPGGQTLDKISTRTGAHLFRMNNDVYMKGTPEAKEKARYEVQFIVGGGRMIDLSQEMRGCCFVDDFNLSKDCDLCLVPSQCISAAVVPTVQTQYRLRLSEDCQNSNESSPSANNENPCYIEELTDYVKQSLDEIREGINSGQQRRNDMWLHFGTVVIRDVDEDEADKQWTLGEVAKKLAVPCSKDMKGNKQHTSWKTIFREGITFDAEPALGNYLKRPGYDARHDIKILTPSGRQVRCKVWIRHEELKENAEHDEIPFNDIKNILEEVCFKNEQTKARCKGWLCLPSTIKLKADIIFPVCEFDCRLTLRTSQVFAKEQNPTEKEENKILLDYFSDLTLKEGEELLSLDQTLPSDFRVIYNRRSRRASYSDGEDFTIIVSREMTDPSGKEVTDLHLHCNKWDEWLQSADWKPEEIVEKFPSFFKFVSKVQQLIVHYQEAQASSGS